MSSIVSYLTFRYIYLRSDNDIVDQLGISFQNICELSLVINDRKDRKKTKKYTQKTDIERVHFDLKLLTIQMI